MQFPYHFHPLPLGVEIILMLRPRTPKVLRISLMSSASWRDLARSGEIWRAVNLSFSVGHWMSLGYSKVTIVTFKIVQHLSTSSTMQRLVWKTFENV